MCFHGKNCGARRPADCVIAADTCGEVVGAAVPCLSRRDVAEMVRRLPAASGGEEFTGGDLLCGWRIVVRAEHAAAAAAGELDVFAVDITRHTAALLDVHRDCACPDRPPGESSGPA